MNGVAMEGPLPPLTKIDDDVEGVEVEVMLALKALTICMRLRVSLGL